MSDTQSPPPTSDAEWSRRVRECLARKEAEPGASFIITDSEGATWRV